MIPESLGPVCDQETRRIVLDHIASCPGCAREYKESRAVADMLGDRGRPELSDAFWARWDDRLVRGLDAIDRERSVIKKAVPLSWFKPRIRLFGTVSAAAALLIIGISIGRFFPESSHQDRTAVVAPAMPVSAVTADAMRFLDRSKLVLLGMDVAESTADEDFTPEYRRLREISRELLRESPALQERLGDANHVRLAALLSELDIILIQIANIDERHETQDLELIRAGIESKSLLFKIGIETIVTDSMRENPGLDGDRQGRL
jgi:hypothetical protein